MILIFQNARILRQNLENFRSNFPSYTGGDEIADVISYIRNLYVDRSEFAGYREHYVSFSEDGSFDLKWIIAAINDTLIQENQRDMGFL